MNSFLYLKPLWKDMKNTDLFYKSDVIIIMYGHDPINASPPALISTAPDSLQVAEKL